MDALQAVEVGSVLGHAWVVESCGDAVCWEYLAVGILQDVG